MLHAQLSAASALAAWRDHISGPAAEAGARALTSSNINRGDRRAKEIRKKARPKKGFRTPSGVLALKEGIVLAVKYVFCSKEVDIQKAAVASTLGVAYDFDSVELAVESVLGFPWLQGLSAWMLVHTSFAKEDAISHHTQRAWNLAYGARVELYNITEQHWEAVQVEEDVEQQASEQECATPIHPGAFPANIQAGMANLSLHIMRCTPIEGSTAVAGATTTIEAGAAAITAAGGDVATAAARAAAAAAVDAGATVAVDAAAAAAVAVDAGATAAAAAIAAGGDAATAHHAAANAAGAAMSFSGGSSVQACIAATSAAIAAGAEAWRANGHWQLEWAPAIPTTSTQWAHVLLAECAEGIMQVPKWSPPPGFDPSSPLNGVIGTIQDGDLNGAVSLSLDAVLSTCARPLLSSGACGEAKWLRQVQCFVEFSWANQQRQFYSAIAAVPAPSPAELLAELCGTSKRLPLLLTPQLKLEEAECLSLELIFTCFMYHFFCGINQHASAMPSLGRGLEVCAGLREQAHVLLLTCAELRAEAEALELPGLGPLLVDVVPLLPKSFTTPEREFMQAMVSDWAKCEPPLSMREKACCFIVVAGVRGKVGMAVTLAWILKHRPDWRNRDHICSFVEHVKEERNRLEHFGGEGIGGKSGAHWAVSLLDGDQQSALFGECGICAYVEEAWGGMAKCGIVTAMQLVEFHKALTTKNIKLAIWKLPGRSTKQQHMLERYSEPPGMSAASYAAYKMTSAYSFVSKLVANFNGKLLFSPDLYTQMRACQQGEIWNDLGVGSCEAANAVLVEFARMEWDLLCVAACETKQLINNAQIEDVPSLVQGATKLMCPALEAAVAREHEIARQSNSCGVLSTPTAAAK